MTISKPLLAVAAEIENIKFPVIASPKLDGIRCLKVNGKVVSRNFKPIPNKYIRTILEKILPDGADGEIIVGDTFQDVTSGVMSFDGEPNFTYHMFDYVKDSLDKPFIDRLKDMENWIFGYYLSTDDRKIKFVESVLINNQKQLDELEERYLKLNYEGVMIRSVDGRYKCGRSTVKEGILLKIKRWQHSEARITGFGEKMRNENEATIDALGHTERSTHKEGMVPADTLGKIFGEDIHHPEWGQMRFGSGLNDELREKIWSNQEEYLGKIIRYKYQEPGMKDKPRFPIFEGFRHPDDL